MMKAGMHMPLASKRCSRKPRRRRLCGLRRLSTPFEAEWKPQKCEPGRIAWCSPVPQTLSFIPKCALTSLKEKADITDDSSTWSEGVNLARKLFVAP